MIGWTRKIITSAEYTIDDEDGKRFKVHVDERTDMWFQELTTADQHKVLRMLTKTVPC